MTAMPYDPSPRALRGLRETYWGPQGWRLPSKLPRTPAVERTITAGLMFAQSWTIDHDDLVERARRAATADLDIGKRLLDALRTGTAATTSTSVLPTLTMVPGNKAERAALVDILGLCGILETPGHPGHARAFIPADRRELPPRHHVDRAYPVCWWTGAHGVNEDNLPLFLPQLAAQR